MAWVKTQQTARAVARPTTPAATQNLECR
jgi:hypothetical protein